MFIILPNVNNSMYCLMFKYHDEYMYKISGNQQIPRKSLEKS